MDLQFEMELRVDSGPRMHIHVADDYVRGIALTLDGTFSGPRIAGRVIPGSGGTFPLIRHDGGGRFETQYMLETDDGALILMRSLGVRQAPSEVIQALLADEQVDHQSYYMRMMPRFEAPEGRYDWLNRSMFVCVGMRDPAVTILRCWRVV